MEAESSEVKTPTPEDLAAEAAAFSAVFNPDQEPEIKPEEEAPEIKEGSEVKVEEPVIEDPKPLTVDDLKAMLDEQRDISKKAHDKLAGTVGNLQQRIESARASAAGFSPKVRERVSAEFPELAQLLFDDDPTGETPTKEHVVIPTDEPTAEDIAEAKELLTLDHPDWETVTASKEYADWLTTLPQAVQNKVAKSYDPIFGSSMITKFKTAQTEKANNATSEAEKAAAAAEKAKKDKEKLDAAVAPRGVPRTATAGNGQDDEETAAFKAAFKQTQSRR